MAIERTLSIIKPDAVAKCDRPDLCPFRSAGLKIVAAKLVRHLPGT